MTFRIKLDVGRLSSFAALSSAARTCVSKRTDVTTPDPALPTLAFFLGILASIYFSAIDMQFSRIPLMATPAKDQARPRPLTWRVQIRGCAWWIAGGGQPQCNNATGVFAGNPACQLSLQGSKSFTRVETSRHRDKDSNPTTGATGAWRHSGGASRSRLSQIDPNLGRN